MHITTPELDNDIKLHSSHIRFLADKLADNTSVTHLDLALHGIDDEDAKYLFDKLVSNRTLAMLNLNRNNIGDEGAKAAARLLKSSSNGLHTLWLAANKIGDGACTLSPIARQMLTRLQLRFQRARKR